MTKQTGSPRRLAPSKRPAKRSGTAPRRLTKRPARKR